MHEYVSLYVRCVFMFVCVGGGVCWGVDDELSMSHTREQSVM